MTAQSLREKALKIYSGYDEATSPISTKVLELNARIRQLEHQKAAVEKDSRPFLQVQQHQKDELLFALYDEFKHLLSKDWGNLFDAYEEILHYLLYRRELYLFYTTELLVNNRDVPDDHVKSLLDEFAEKTGCYVSVTLECPYFIIYRIGLNEKPEKEIRDDSFKLIPLGNPNQTEKVPEVLMHIDNWVNLSDFRFTKGIRSTVKV